jgi:hypothetical protein
MKLADDALIRIIEILRQGLMENKDISDLLRGLDLEPNLVGKLGVTQLTTDWTSTEQAETD